MYRVEITFLARQEIRELPGNMRQRVIRLLKALQEEPRPHNSKQMNLASLGCELESNITLHRIRVESWRVVYVLEEELQLLTVLAIRKRPPYQYDDLRQLLDQVMGTDQSEE